MLLKNKICHFSTVHSAYDVRIRERECVSLVNAGAEVHLFAGDVRNTYVSPITHNNSDNSKNDLVMADNVNEEYKGVKIHFLPELPNRYKRFQYAKIAINNILAQKPQIIHFHDPELIVSMLKVKKKQRNVKIIFDCHEDSISHIILKKYIPRLLKPSVRKILSMYFKRAALEFDAIITADDEVSNMFKSWGAKPTVLYNFPPKDIYNKAPEWNFADRAYDLIYPGSTPQYHLETMFNIASELKKRGRRTKWLILTQFAFIDKLWIQNKLKELDIEGFFDFKQLVPLPELPTYLRMAKVGIIPLPDTPKFHKNIPSKLFDFFLAGLPVVLSDLPPSKKFIEGFDIALTVKAGDINAYASAIHHLLDSQSRMPEMGKRARELALQNYTWETQLKRLVGLYASLI